MLEFDVFYGYPGDIQPLLALYSKYTVIFVVFFGMDMQGLKLLCDDNPLI